MKNIALAWHSVGHGMEVLNNFVRLLKERGTTLDEIYLLHQKGTILKREESRQNYTPVPFSLKNPTDHEKIYSLVRDSVSEIYRRFPLKSTNFHINLSPGTPAMHAVWLLLYASAALKNTSLWQTQLAGNEVSLSPVKIPENSFIQQMDLIKSGDKKATYFPMVYKTEQLNSLLETLRRSQNIREPILITGERGTGKSRLIEHFFHKENIVTLSCGSLTDNLAQSELFGHKRGAFTGADKDYKGYIKEAENGVFFLDEIQDLSKSVQRKLVRFIESGKYRPLGGDRDESSNARLVFASHLFLEELEKTLDSDLFDRISLLNFRVPPLRECLEDMDVFLQNIWEDLAKPASMPTILTLDAPIKRRVIETGLQGNFRNLKSFLLHIILEYDTFSSFGDVAERALNRWLEGMTRVESAVDITPLLPLHPEEAVRNIKYRLASQYLKIYENPHRAAEEKGVATNTINKWLSYKEKQKN